MGRRKKEDIKKETETESFVKAFKKETLEGRQRVLLETPRTVLFHPEKKQKKMNEKNSKYIMNVV